MAKRVLLVDDDFSDLEFMKKTLAKAGFTVTAVTNGASALDLVTNDDFDLILIDVLMPTLSGHDLMRLLKERVKKTKVAFVTIVPEKDVDMSHVDGFLHKPFDAKTFLAKVNAIMK